MIDIIQNIQRVGLMWDDVPIWRVGLYLKELLEVKEGLEKFNYAQERVLGIAKERVDDILELIEREEDVCNFYISYLELRKGGNFNRWVSVTKASEGVRDCWTKYNGKVRALISIGRKADSQTVRVSLHVENNSEFLNFFYDGHSNRRREIVYSNLKNKESILKRVEEYKEKADEIMSELQYPKCCRDFIWKWEDRQNRKLLLLLSDSGKRCKRDILQLMARSD